MTELIRLDKFLSSQLNISRTDAKKLVRKKEITVNGKLCGDAGLSVDAGRDEVAVGGKRVAYKKYVYIMMNKPSGVVSASSSSDDVTVVDILPEEMKRSGLFPAGRLDKDTTGFVLITDDGGFAHDILSPSRHVPKTYTVTLERDPTEAEAELIRGGITAGGETFKPALLIKKDLPGCVWEITIRQGRYHQIKRTFAATGNRVAALHRDKIGGLSLDPTLKPGECRELTADEIALITQAKGS